MLECYGSVLDNILNASGCNALAALTIYWYSNPGASTFIHNHLAKPKETISSYEVGVAFPGPLWYHSVLSVFIFDIYSSGKLYNINHISFTQFYSR